MLKQTWSLYNVDSINTLQPHCHSIPGWLAYSPLGPSPQKRWVSDLFKNMLLVDAIHVRNLAGARFQTKFPSHHVDGRASEQAKLFRIEHTQLRSRRKFWFHRTVRCRQGGARSFGLCLRLLWRSLSEVNCPTWDKLGETGWVLAPEVMLKTN